MTVADPEPSPDLSAELARVFELAELADAYTLPRFEQADFT